ncbi:MAG: PAS domain S-box protein [Candidatus Binatia bacterium]
MNPEDRNIATDCLAGGGEMGRLMRAKNWSATPLGPVLGWPQSLKTAVRILLGSRYPMFVWWGPEMIMFHNDAYVPILGKRHPDALGKSGPVVWSDIWEDIRPLIEPVLDEGRACWQEERLLVMERNDYTEEAYFTFSYSPIPNDDGSVGGIFCACSEDTVRVLNRRRLKTLRELAEQTAQARTVEEACNLAALVLADNRHDIPFSLIYRLDADSKKSGLAGKSGLTSDSPACPAEIDLTLPANSDLVWPLGSVMTSGVPEIVTELLEVHGGIAGGVWPEPTESAIVLPIRKSGQDTLAGFLVAGISPRRQFDDDYRGFMELIAGHIAAAIANACAYEEERRRAETLAELDRAKTAFFSNVSHEFRTPLTLMLGPINDILAKPDAQVIPANRELLTVAHRNGQRLLKLVNTLLDFSRIEAGRGQAVYEPVELATYTAELASVFRSAIQRAGMRLKIDCPPLPEPVFVDRDMWEKIVLNLISNAFKYTLEGEIQVALRAKNGTAVLSVRDTGTGIPEAELSNIFNRFHRVEGARGRTHEGTGIGLALVQELVKLHGGTVEVESIYGEGSIFTVNILFGKEHLPADRIGASRTLVSTALGAEPFVEEALRSLPTETAESEISEKEALPSVSLYPLSAVVPVSGTRSRIILADDNADMRDYVRRLLAPPYEVIAVGDGNDALQAALNQRPDLILTDVMMPNLDGFGLLRALRTDPRTASIPVIVLSARAGEEARVEGLGAGADDYLIKPFSARELLARVSATLELARVRRDSEERLRLATQTGKVGVWDWDIARNHISWTDSLYLIHGVAPDDFDATVEGFAALVHPEDREFVSTAINRTLDEDVPYDLEFRAVRPDGEVIWLFTNAVVVRDGGRPIRMLGATVDITQRKRAELAVRESEERFRTLANHAPVGIFLTDTNGDCFFVNQSWCAMSGLTPEQAQGKSWTKSLHPDDRERIAKEWYEAVQRRERFASEYRFTRPNGIVTWLQGSAVELLNDNRLVIGHIGTVVDITARKKAEEALRESEERFRHMADNAPVMVWVTEPDGASSFLSKSWYDFTGQTPETGLGFGWLAATHPDDRAKAQEIFIPANARKEAFRLEYRLRRKDGEYRWAIDAATPRFAADGRFLGYIGSVIDIAERKRTEEALRQSEENFRNLADNMSQLAWMADERGWIFWYNKRWFDYTGTTLEEVQGWEWKKVHHPDHVDRVVARIQQSWDTGELWEDTFPLRGKDGQYRWFLSRAMPILDSTRRIFRWFGTNTDITEQREMEEALREADRRKDEFLATLAHELRNPLAPIRNGLQIMRLAGENRDIVEQARGMMERQLQQMVRLIDDLLDLSRISQGKVELRKERVELSAVVRNALETSRPLIEESGHELTINAPSEPVFVEADTTRLAQVFANLLNNAAKYTENDGHIWLTVDSRGSEVVVSVKDNGVGIPAHMLSRVFEMFAQVDGSPERTQSGLGIGLNIAERLVKMHGGAIEARSNGPGTGSEFIVRLPVFVSPVAELERPSVNGGQVGSSLRRRILVADDNVDSASSMAMMLEIMGNEVRTARDGLEALEVAEVFRPEVILLDIGMPGINGYEACRRIREQPWGRDVVVVALTGWGLDGDKRRAREAGFDDHLVKPADPAKLEKLLAASEGV